MDKSRFESNIKTFNEATDRFYAKQMTVKEYKGVSGGMGSYAQRGAEKSMVRLRLAGGRITRDKLAFICDVIDLYRPSMVHLTTCQSVQLHNLGPDAVKAIVDVAPDHGIITYGGGGDYPRNVTATPLAGLIAASRMDVMPYAQAVEDYLLDFSFGKKLPRKLKVGFSCTKENVTDATARDLGFIATENGRFDVYSGGGLGKNPKLGLLIASDVDPQEVFVYANAMFRLFMAHGNYTDRAKARVRYMRDTLGDEGYRNEFLKLVKENLADKSIPSCVVNPIVVTKKGDGSTPSSERAKPQCQEGLYYVTYHPIGGDPSPSKIQEIYNVVADMKDVEVRISPNQTMYVVNLTGSEADRVADITSDGARTVFEASVSCVGSGVCQMGLRDSPSLLRSLIDMEKRKGFADRVLPMIRISGCANSCSAHQLGTVALAGGPSVDGEPAFIVFVNGSHILGKEKLGLELGSVKISEMPAFFEAVGDAVTASGLGSFREWFNGEPSRMEEIGKKYLH